MLRNDENEDEGVEQEKVNGVNDDKDRARDPENDSDVVSADSRLLGRLHRLLRALPPAGDNGGGGGENLYKDARSRNLFLPPLSNAMARSPAFEDALRRFVREHVCPALGVGPASSPQDKAPPTVFI